jgi:hypothetical protein
MSRLVEYRTARQDAFRTGMHPKACIIFSTERIKPDGLHKAVHILSLTGQRSLTIVLLTIDNFFYLNTSNFIQHTSNFFISRFQNLKIHNLRETAGLKQPKRSSA